MRGDSPRRSDLWIDGRRIAAIVPPDAAPDWEPGSYEERDLEGFWILPGFVQAHVHLCQTLFRGMADGRRLYPWLEQVIWPMEAALDEATIAVAAEAGLAQLLAGGSTTILDMGTTRHTGELAAVVAGSGIRAFIGPAWMDRGPEAASGLLRPSAELTAEVESLAGRWHGHDDGRIRLALCPRFVPSVSDTTWRDIAGRAEWRGFPIHTHGSETVEENDEVRARTGRSPSTYLAALPGAEGRTVMAHGVWLDDADRRALRESGVAVAHCPGSNLKLGSGLADIQKMQDAGITVGLGADGAACNNRLDMWQEMRLAASVATALHGPESVRPAAILEMATAGGAEALGLADAVGALRAGLRADLVVLDPSSEPACVGAVAGAEGPESLLVHAGSPQLVAETWVDGRCVYRRDDPDARDRARELDRRVRAARERLLRS